VPVTPQIQLEIDAAVSEFRLNEGEYRALLAGPIAKDLVRRAIRVEAAAKRNATGAPPSAPGHGPGVVTGRVRGSITWRLMADAEGPFVDVGTAVFYAPFLELGTRFIEPRPFLVPALNAARY
jgi:hypothetical protein